MNVLRALLVVVILLELALIVVFLEVRGVRLRYALARRQEAAHKLSVGNHSAQLDVARARRPDELERRAARFGLSLQETATEGQRP